MSSIYIYTYMCAYIYIYIHRNGSGYIGMYSGYIGAWRHIYICAVFL